MYKIGKIIINISNIKNNKMLENLIQFTTTYGKSQAEYEIKYLDNFNEINNLDFIYRNEYFSVQKLDERYNYYWIDKNIYAITEELGNGKYNIYLHKNIINSEVHKYFLPSLLNLERPLLKQDCFCLHSSYIAYKDQAILFTAPSGFGKSTQADLWMKYKNAEILNGDRNIVGKDEGHWFVYGTPFSGSSEYCVNRTTSLNTMIILEKGPVNQIKRLDIRGFNRVFSQTTVCPWDQEFCNKVMDLVMSACSEVPVYLYSCTKDESAVDFLCETLLKDGVLNG